MIYSSSEYVIFIGFLASYSGARGLTCINGDCYDRSFGSMSTFGDCPVVICDNNCNDYVVWSDGCAICKCSRSTKGTREMCNKQADCSSDGKCQNNLCTYTNVPDNLPKACVFDHQCKSSESCLSPKCNPGASVRHLENVSCVFQHQCPNGYTCGQSMTCYEGGKDVDHQQGVSCVFDYQCKSRYRCENMSCVYSGRAHSSTQCTLPWQCQENEVCENMSCYPDS